MSDPDVVAQNRKWRDRPLYAGGADEPILVTLTLWDGVVYAHCNVCYSIDDPNGCTFGSDAELITHLDLHRGAGSFSGDAAAVVAAAVPSIGSVWDPTGEPDFIEIARLAREVLDACVRGRSDLVRALASEILSVAGGLTAERS